MFIVEEFNANTNLQHSQTMSCQLNNHPVNFSAQAGVVEVLSDVLTCGVALNNRQIIHLQCGIAATSCELHYMVLSIIYKLCFLHDVDVICAHIKYSRNVAIYLEEKRRETGRNLRLNLCPFITNDEVWMVEISIQYTK